MIFLRRLSSSSSFLFFFMRAIKLRMAVPTMQLQSCQTRHLLRTLDCKSQDFTELKNAVQYFSWTIVWFFQNIGWDGWFSAEYFGSCWKLFTDFVKVANINYITIYEILLCVISNLLTMAILDIQDYHFAIAHNGTICIATTTDFRSLKQPMYISLAYWKVGLEPWARLAVYCVLFVSFSLVLCTTFFTVLIPAELLLAWMGMSDHRLHPSKNFRRTQYVACHIHQVHRNIHRHIQPNGHPYRLWGHY